MDQIGTFFGAHAKQIREGPAIEKGNKVLRPFFREKRFRGMQKVHWSRRGKVKFREPPHVIASAEDERAKFRVPRIPFRHYDEEGEGLNSTCLSLTFT
jgi:hypothetical protein